jgi:hypothetical protein
MFAEMLYDFRHSKRFIFENRSYTLNYSGQNLRARTVTDFTGLSPWGANIFVQLIKMSCLLWKVNCCVHMSLPVLVSQVRRIQPYSQALHIKSKGKVVPLRSIEAQLGERKYSSYSFLTSALEGGEWSASHPVTPYIYTYIFKYILILSLLLSLGILSDLLRSGFPIEVLHAFFTSPTCAMWPSCLKRQRLMKRVGID